MLKVLDKSAQEPIMTNGGFLYEETNFIGRG